MDWSQCFAHHRQMVGFANPLNISNIPLYSLFSNCPQFTLFASTWPFFVCVCNEMFGRCILIGQRLSNLTNSKEIFMGKSLFHGLLSLTGTLCFDCGIYLVVTLVYVTLVVTQFYVTLVVTQRKATRLSRPVPSRRPQFLFFLTKSWYCFCVTICLLNCIYSLLAQIP